MEVATVERAAGIAILRALGVFLLVVGVVGAVTPRQPAIPYDMVLVRLFLVALLAAGAARGLVGRRFPPCPPTFHRWVPFAITAVGSTICTLFAIATRYDFGWDARVVADMARRVVLGVPFTTFDYGYLSRYPNNLSLLSVDRFCAWFGNAVGLPASVVFILVNGLCLALAVQSCYWLASMLRDRRAGMAAQLLVLVFVGLSPWMTVSYTDLIAVPFPLFAVALAVAAVRAVSRRRQVALVAASSVALLIGYEIKNTPVVTLVAFVVVAALALTARDAAARRLIAGALVAGLAVFGAGALVARQALPTMAGVRSDRIDRSRTPPLAWWFYMGTTEHTDPSSGLHSYGSYDSQIVAATINMHRGAAGQYAERLLRRRMSRLGPVGYVKFLGNKAAWNWGDGMFWAYGEGSDDVQPVLADDALTPFVRAWNNPQASGYRWRAALTQALWLLLLVVAGARLLHARWRWDLGLVVLSVLGIAAFTLVFQGRSRYLLVYVPLLITLATCLPPLRERGGWLSRGRAVGLTGGDDDGRADGEVAPG